MCGSDFVSNGETFDTFRHFGGCWVGALAKLTSSCFRRQKAFCVDC